MVLCCGVDELTQTYLQQGNTRVVLPPIVVVGVEDKRNAVEVRGRAPELADCFDRLVDVPQRNAVGTWRAWPVDAEAEHKLPLRDVIHGVVPEPAVAALLVWCETHEGLCDHSVSAKVPVLDAPLPPVLDERREQRVVVDQLYLKRRVVIVPRVIVLLPGAQCHTQQHCPTAHAHRSTFSCGVCFAEEGGEEEREQGDRMYETEQKSVKRKKQTFEE